VNTNEPAQMPERPVAPSSMSNWKTLALAIVITALLTGVGGYLLGKGTNQSTQGFSFQPSPTLFMRPNQSTQRESFQLSPTPGLLSSSWTSWIGSSSTSSATEIVSSDDKIVSFDDKTNIYINSTYGFAIPYSKYSWKSFDGWDCPGYINTNKTNNIPLKLFEVKDTKANKIYIADEVFIEAKGTVGENGVDNTDRSSCKIIQTTLKQIMNQPRIKDYTSDTGIRSYTNYYGPDYVQYNYRRIDSDNDLLTLAQSKYPNCSVCAKRPVENSPGVYDIELVDKTGGEGDFFKSSCPLNFKYFSVILMRESVQNHPNSQLCKTGSKKFGYGMLYRLVRLDAWCLLQSPPARTFLLPYVVELYQISTWRIRHTSLASDR
jgi:hypothetical protein